MSPHNLRNLKQPKTLLLLGGAFGIAALVAWCAWDCRFVLDRTGSAPAEAVAAVSLRQQVPEKVAAALPADLMGSLSGSSAYATRSATGTVEWHPLLGAGHWRIVSRDVGAVGFGVSDGRFEPFTATFGDKGVALRVGKGFRGLDFESHNEQPRLIRSFPKPSYLYISDSNPSSDSDRIGVLGDLMKNLKGRMELVLAKQGDSKLQPFIIIVSPGGEPMDFKAIDASMAQTVGKFDPSNLNVILPDHSNSKELRSSVSGVKVEERKLTSGTLRRFTGTSGKVELDYFRKSDGSLWISNHLEILEGFTEVSEDSSLNFPLCTDLGDRFTTVMHPKADSATGTVPEWITNGPKGFDSVVFSLKQAETGLFTLCGYLD